MDEPSAQYSPCSLKRCVRITHYIRVSKDDQDLNKQRHLLLEYSQRHKLLIDEFIEVEISSRKTQRERRITELLIGYRTGICSL